MCMMHGLIPSLTMMLRFGLDHRDHVAPTTVQVLAVGTCWDWLPVAPIWKPCQFGTHSLDLHMIHKKSNSIAFPIGWLFSAKTSSRMLVPFIISTCPMQSSCGVVTSPCLRWTCIECSYTGTNDFYPCEADLSEAKNIRAIAPYCSCLRKDPQIEIRRHLAVACDFSSMLGCGCGTVLLFSLSATCAIPIPRIVVSLLEIIDLDGSTTALYGHNGVFNPLADKNYWNILESIIPSRILHLSFWPFPFAGVLVRLVSESFDFASVLRRCWEAQLKTGEMWHKWCTVICVQCTICSTWM